MSGCFARKVIFNHEELASLCQAVLSQDLKDIKHLFHDYELPQAQKNLIDVFIDKEGSSQGYDVEKMARLRRQNDGSIFGEFGTLKEWVSKACADDSFAHLNDVLWKVVKQSFQSLFDHKGDIKPWVRRAMGVKHFKELAQTFNANQLKQKLLQEYLYLFCGHCARREKEGHLKCAVIMIELLKHEIHHFSRISTSLYSINQSLSSVDGKRQTFYEPLKEFYRFSHQLFFSGAVSSHDNFYLLMHYASVLVGDPENKEALGSLCLEKNKCIEERSVNYLKIARGSLVMLLGALLMLSALLFFPVGLGVWGALGGALSGIVGIFWGLSIIEGGLKATLEEKISDFSDSIKVIQKENKSNEPALTSGRRPGGGYGGRYDF